MATSPNGFFLIDKGSGMTSHDVVNKLRRITGQRRIGHAGTLDPLATGLLLVFVGKSTRAVEYAMGGEKEYLAEMKCGISTDSQDITGEIIRTSDQAVSVSDLESVLPSFQGWIYQIPPMYSAVKKNGKKLYEYARKGIQIDRDPRKVYISELLLTSSNPPDFHLKVVCSKGTYVRTLISDIGDALGSGAVMTHLRRTRIGSFSVAQAVTLSQLEKPDTDFRDYIHSTDELFLSYPRYTLNTDEERKFCNGVPLNVQLSFPEGRIRVYSSKGQFLSICNWTSGILTMERNFFEQENLDVL